MLMLMFSLSLIICLFTLRPLSVTLHMYIIIHQIMAAQFAYYLTEDDEDDYPWKLH